MGYAKHIGRVGALAVTLGVGVAIATTPGIAYAETPGASSTDSSSTTGTTGADGVDGAHGDDGDSSGLNHASGSVGDDAGEATEDAEDAEDVDDEDAEDAEDDADEQDSEEETDAPPSDEETPQTEEPSGDSVAEQESNGSAKTQVADISDDVDDAAVSGQPDGSSDQSRDAETIGLADASARSFSADTSEPDTSEPDTSESTFAALSTRSEPAGQAANLVTVVTEVISNLVNAVLQPFLSSGTGSPIQIPILSAVLAAVRDEMERNRLRTSAPVMSQQTISALEATDQHVLLIGVDGANLSRILALDDADNANFRELMSVSTNSAPSIVGHTTISNPSWSAILTGEWSEKTGVINNVFTPWTYEKYPTVFNQLEALPGEIDTMTVADWNVINAISGAGSAPVDTNVFVAQIEGDTNWLATDDKVADLTIDAIVDAEGPPDFLFSYFVGVDENGHLYGGASEEYKQALINMDDNLGQIMDAIETSGEEWTIIVVTDHGHQPQKGFGHGFQSPDETATFVIASGPGFGDSFINLDYEIVDTTPTVVALFGGEPKPGSDGVTLMSLSGSDEGPLSPEALRAALEAQLASNQSPGLITTAALSLRTVFATIPYLVYNLGLPSPIHDVLYIATNVPAQIVAFLTGVHGASIFPILPPPPPSDFIQDPATTTLLACADSADAQACIAS